ncbi:MAG: site-2 protease family protein [Chloroflexi bacterium]|nr:site-2 protease family protein [Chloroflexota bacterium]
MITSVVFIVGFIGLLAVLILVHEAGHFFVAKASGVKVLEFGLGFPPRLLGFRKGETLYSLNAIPLGGFVKMVGEEDPSEPRSLAAQSILVRFLVISAGPFMNALMALVLFTALYLVPQDVVVGRVTIVSVLPGSPAEAAGLLPGDQVAAVEGNNLDNHGDLAYLLRANLGKEMTWTVLREGRKLDVNVTPRLSPPPGQGPTGITISTEDPRTVSRSMAPWTAAGNGLRTIVDVVTLTRREISRGLASGQAPQVTGPIGMAQAFSEVGREPSFGLKERVLIALNLGAVISLSLAVFNILPIPALDGGRLPFLLIEWVRRGKRVPPKAEALVHLVGFALLMGLVILISVMDLVRITQGRSLLGG